MMTRSVPRPSAGRAGVAALLAIVPLSLSQAATDLALSKLVDNPTPMAGEPVEFTIEVQNLGSSAASDVHVQDRLPPGTAIPAGRAAFASSGDYDPMTGDWAVGDLDAGVLATLVVPAIVTDPQPPPCIVNTATTAHADDANPDNDAASAALRQAGVRGCADLQLEMDITLFGAALCATERTLDVIVRVSNRGPDVARNVMLELTQSPTVAPEFSFVSSRCNGDRCDLGDMLPGEIQVLLRSSQTLRNPSPQTVTLAAAIFTADVDYAPDDNTIRRQRRIPAYRACDVDFGIESPTGGCFVATAAFGSSLDPHVETLRRFRDDFLQTHASGRAFVRFYYRHSPAMADYIRPRPRLRAFTRAVLTPLVLTIAHPRWAAALFGALAVLTVLVPVARARRPAARCRPLRGTAAGASSDAAS